MRQETLNLILGPLYSGLWWMDCSRKIQSKTGRRKGPVGRSPEETRWRVSHWSHRGCTQSVQPRVLTARVECRHPEKFWGQTWVLLGGWSLRFLLPSMDQNPDSQKGTGANSLGTASPSYQWGVGGKDPLQFLSFQKPAKGQSFKQEFLKTVLLWLTPLCR